MVTEPEPGRPAPPGLPLPEPIFRWRILGRLGIGKLVHDRAPCAAASARMLRRLECLADRRRLPSLYCSGPDTLFPLNLPVSRREPLPVAAHAPLNLPPRPQRASAESRGSRPWGWAPSLPALNIAAFPPRGHYRAATSVHHPWDATPAQPAAAGCPGRQQRGLSTLARAFREPRVGVGTQQSKWLQVVE